MQNHRRVVQTRCLEGDRNSQKAGQRGKKASRQAEIKKRRLKKACVGDKIRLRIKTNSAKEVLWVGFAGFSVPRGRPGEAKWSSGASSWRPKVAPGGH